MSSSSHAEWPYSIWILSITSIWNLIMLTRSAVASLLVAVIIWDNVASLRCVRPRTQQAPARHRVRLEAYLDPAGAISVLSDLSQNFQLWLSGGSDDRHVAVQNSLLVTAALGYFTYEGRPRGDARDDLVDIRKSLMIKDNLGVFAKSFIAQETVLGHFPGFIRTTAEVRRLKISDEARRSAKRYLWAISEAKVLDPTNAAGRVDLNLPFLLGLYKVSTTLARLNEPPEGGDVNCYIRIEGEGEVAIIAERDIIANEELYIDYGPDFDRSDYARYQTPPVREAAPQRIEPITASSLESLSWDQTGNAADTAITAASAAQPMTGGGGGFLSRLAREGQKYARSGILSPEEGASRLLLLQQGNGEIGMLGKEADMGRREGSGNTQEGGDDLLASLQTQPGGTHWQQQSLPDLSRDGTSQGVTSKDVDSRGRASISPEAAARIAALDGRLAGMSDAQVEEVFRRLRASVLDKLQGEVRYRRAQQGPQSAEAVAQAQDARHGAAPDAQDDVVMALTASGEAGDLRAVIDGVLRDMARDPLRVWQEISQDPEKYLSGDDDLAGMAEMEGQTA